MFLGTYGINALFMLGILGKTNPPNRSVIGFGHGFIPGPGVLGELGFCVAIPILAAIPVLLVALPFRRAYRGIPERQNRTGINVTFLLCGIVLGILNASLYRGD